VTVTGVRADPKVVSGRLVGKARRLWYYIDIYIYI